MTPPANPLSIDLGRHVGWACGGQSGQACILPRQPMQETDRWAAMADRLSMFVSDLIDEHQPDCAVVERPWFHPKSPRAGIVLHILLGPVLVVLRRRDLLIDVVEPCVWQRWAKPRGWTKTDDATDARFIREWFLAERVPLIRTSAA